MPESANFPEAFGNSWAEFIEEWCLGVPPATSPEECIRALHALLHHWPEHAQTLIAAQTRGLAVVANAIDMGLILADTANLPGVGHVLSRLRAGERSTFSELAVAAVLLRLGFSPALGMPAGQKVPDLALTVRTTTVYTEVIAPDRGQIEKDAIDKITTIASSLLAVATGANVELFLDCDLENLDIALLTSAVADASFTDQPIELPSFGRILKRPFSFPPVVSPSIASGTPRTVLGAARSVVDGTSGALVAVRVAVFDGRAKRLLTAELHHLPKSNPNIVVINAGNVPGGINDWVPVLRNCFQPTRNTRISAILLYQTGVLGNPLDVHRAWQMLVNKFAANPLPAELLDALSKLPTKWPIEAAQPIT